MIIYVFSQCCTLAGQQVSQGELNSFSWAEQPEGSDDWNRFEESPGCLLQLADMYEKRPYCDYHRTLSRTLRSAAKWELGIA